MATHHASIPSTQSQSIRRSLIPSRYHYDCLQGYTEIAGTPARELLDEALEIYIQCTLLARVEALMERTKKAERAEKKAKRKAERDKEINGYLAKLESTLD